MIESQASLKRGTSKVYLVVDIELWTEMNEDKPDLSTLGKDLQKSPA